MKGRTRFHVAHWPDMSWAASNAGATIHSLPLCCRKLNRIREAAAVLDEGKTVAAVARLDLTETVLRQWVHAPAPIARRAALARYPACSSQGGQTIRGAGAALRSVFFRAAGHQ